MFFFLHQLIIVYNESLSVYQFTVCLYDRLSFYQFTKSLYDRLSIYSPILFSPVLNDCLTGKAYLTWPRQHLSRPRYYKVKLVNFLQYISSTSTGVDPKMYLQQLQHNFWTAWIRICSHKLYPNWQTLFWFWTATLVLDYSIFYTKLFF